MTSGVFNSRPNATIATTNVSLFGGGATVHATLTDNLDTTWVRVTTPTTSFWEFIVGFPTITLGATEYVYRRRVRMRMSYDNNGAVGSPNVANWDVWMTSATNVGQAPKDHYGPVHYGDQDPFVQNGGWKQPSDASKYWVQADFNTPRVRVYGFIGSTAFYPRIYEMYLDREIKTLPTTTVSLPTGTQTVTTQPATVFTYGSVDNFPMTGYQVKIFTSAQYGAGGFDPDVTIPVWDSGVVYPKGNQVPDYVRPTIPLTNGITYKSYVQVRNGGTQNPNFIPKSTWVASPAYTQNVLPPSVPVITPTQDLANAENDIVIQGTQNMLSYDAASFEIGVGGWAAHTNCSVARVTSKSDDGAASLRITATAGGDAIAAGPFVVVDPGQVYSARAQITANSTLRSVRVGIQWYTIGFASISTDNGSSVAEPNTSFPGATCVVTSVTAPPTAAFARVTVTILSAAAAEIHYTDKVGLKPLADVTWTRGGLHSDGALTSVQFATLLKSIDGGAYEVVASGIELPHGSQRYVYQDQAVPFGLQVTYKAYTTSYDILTPTDAMDSAQTAASAPLTMNINDWWLSDLQVSANSMMVSIINETLKLGEKEEMAKYNPIGRKNPLIVSDVIHGMEAPITVEFLTKQEYDDFRALRGLQKTLLLRSPMVAGEQWYIRILTDVEYEIYNTKPGIYRTAQFVVVEQDVPAL